MNKVKKVFILMLLVLFVIIAVSNNKVEASYVSGGVEVTSWSKIQRELNSNRETEFKVTDANHFKPSQPYFNVDLTKYGYSKDQLISNGFKTIVVLLQLDIKEANDGYQEIYIFDDAANNATNLVNPITYFDHGDGYKNTTYSRYEFYAEIRTSDLDTSSITFRFGAHGKNSDTWYFKGVNIQIGFSQDDKILDSIYNVSNAYVAYI